MMNPHKQGTDMFVLPKTARWRILGWIMLTTGLVMLMIILTARSIFQTQVLYDAHGAIVQEIHEFRTFAGQAIDNKTRKPFTSLTALMERYLERQTPDVGEAFIAVTADSVILVDNARNDAGERLAADRDRLNALLNDGKNSGIVQTVDGELHWGKSSVVSRNEQGTLIVAEFVEDGMSAVRRNMTVLFGIMIVGTLLTAIIAWMVAGQILAPITRFTRISSRVGPFDLTTRLPEIGRDELSGLARSINAMLDRISAAHADLRHVLSKALNQIQQATHDLDRARTRENGIDPTKVDQACAQLMRLDQDLSLLLDSGRKDFLKIGKVALAPFTYALTEDLRTRHPVRGWRVAESAELTVPFDEKRVVQAMHHLASNAVEETATNDVIDVGSSIRTLADGLRVASIWMANPGNTLTQEEAEAIFETHHAYSRNQRIAIPANPDEDDAAPTMGIGLTVVKALAHAHGGYAWVESGGPRGTVFGIDLPLDNPAVVDDEAADDGALKEMSQEKS